MLEEKLFHNKCKTLSFAFSFPAVRVEYSNHPKVETGLRHIILFIPFYHFYPDLKWLVLCHRTVNAMQINCICSYDFNYNNQKFT